MTTLFELKECNKENIKLLDRYKMLCKNKGLTYMSIKAICEIDIPLFLRFIGEKLLKEITHHDLEDFLFYCQNERNNGSAALGRKQTSLNSFFTTLIRKEYLDFKNPMDKIDKIKVRKKVRGHMTIEEIRQMLDYTDSINDLRSGALISLLFSSGCRLTEIYQLDKKTMNFESLQFKVLGKGDKERICIFSDEAKTRILKYIDSRTDLLDYLFVSREHNRLSKKGIEESVKSIAIKAGIEQNVFPHLYRHSTAMALLEANIPLEKIQLVLGHSNISSTQIYAHGNIQDVQKIVDNLNIF